MLRDPRIQTAEQVWLIFLSSVFISALHLAISCTFADRFIGRYALLASCRLLLPQSLYLFDSLSSRQIANSFQGQCIYTDTVLTTFLSLIQTSIHPTTLNRITHDTACIKKTALLFLLFWYFSTLWSPEYTQKTRSASAKHSPSHSHMRVIFHFVL